MKKIFTKILILVGLTVGSISVYYATTPTVIFGSIGSGWSATSTDVGAISPTSINGNKPLINATTSVYTVAASNAPLLEKLQASYVCTGTNDYTGCILPALNAATTSATGATVILSSGTFNIGTAQIAYNSDGACLKGSGQNSTSVTGSNASSTIHIGTRQAGGSLHAYECLSDMTVINTNSGGDQTVWIDGMGHNGTLTNLAIYNQSGGKYSLKLEDIDRDSMTNIYAQGGTIAPIVSMAGLENTWSNFQAENIVIVPQSGTPTVDWLWTHDVNQPSAQAYSRVALNNVHFFGQNGPTASSTGLMFLTAANTFQINIPLFENQDYGIVGYVENDYTLNNASFVMGLGKATANIYQAAYATITFNDNTFQQATAGISVPSGSSFPSFTFNGNNRSGGNLDSVFNSFSNVGLLTGADALFLGDGILSLGSGTQAMGHIYTKDFFANSSYSTSTIAQAGLQMGPASYNSAGYDNLLTLIPQRTFGNSNNASYKEGVFNIDSTLSTRIALNITQQSTAGTGWSPEGVLINQQSTSATGIGVKVKTSSTVFSGNLLVSLQGKQSPALELNEDIWNGGLLNQGQGLYQIASHGHTTGSNTTADFSIDSRNNANNAYCSDFLLSSNFASTTNGRLTLFNCTNATGSSSEGAGRFNLFGTSTVASMVNITSLQGATNEGDLFTVKQTGNVGIGTSTPQSRLQVTSGASATTTVTIGSLGLTSSKSCVNMNAADGSASSFYVSAAHTLIVEANYCR